MRRPFLIIPLVVFLVFAGFAAIGWATGWDGPDRTHTQTIRVVGADGSTISPDSTIVIEADRDWGRGPGFPFGILFFPLFLLFGFFLFSRLFGGRRPWGGDMNQHGPPQAWFEQMHWKSHEEEWNKARHAPPPPSAES